MFDTYSPNPEDVRCPDYYDYPLDHTRIAWPVPSSSAPPARPRVKRIQRDKITEIPPGDQLLDDLKAIRKMVEAHWISGSLSNSEGGHCIVGAAQQVTLGRTIQDIDDRSGPMPVQMVQHLMGYGSVLLWSRRYRRAIRAIKRQGGFTTAWGLALYNDNSHHRQNMLDLVDATIQSRVAHL